jgi:hypothetical protein
MTSFITSKSAKLILFFLVIGLIFAFESSAQSSKVSGRVIDESGEPLSLATVDLINKHGKVITSTITDMDGNYTFELSHMKYELIKVNMLGYLERSINAHLPSPTISMLSIESKEAKDSAFIEQKIGLN